MIVQELYRIQAKHGFLPRSALEALADRLSLPLYRIQEVVSFFPHYRTTPPPEREVQICRDMACALRGSGQLLDDLRKEFANQTAGKLSVCGVSCLGRCDRAPAVRVNRNQHTAEHAEHDTHMLAGRSMDELKRQLRAFLQGGHEV